MPQAMRMRLRVHFGVLVGACSAVALVTAASPMTGAVGSSIAAATLVADSYVRAELPRANFGKASGIVVAGRPADDQPTCASD